jgi:hypothetical protein
MIIFTLKYFRAYGTHVSIDFGNDYYLILSLLQIISSVHTPHLPPAILLILYPSK